MTDTAVVPIDREREAKRGQALLKAIGLDRVPPEQREIALAIAKRYELDLLLKHLVLVDGRPYITRDGLLHVAHRSGQLDGIEVTDAELVKLEGVGEFWRAKASVYRKDMSRPFTYQGRYPAKGGNQRYAPEMAVKVAEVMALRRAFDVSAPVIEERWDVDPSQVVAVEPEPPLSESISARRAAITSGPEARAGAEGAEAVVGPPPGDEPPYPAVLRARGEAQAQGSFSPRSPRRELDASADPASPHAGRTPSSRRTGEALAPVEEPDDPRDTGGPAPDEPGEAGLNKGGDAEASASEATKGSADPARLCGALPEPGNPLGLTLPCEIRATAGHRAHRSSEGTWPA